MKPKSIITSISLLILVFIVALTFYKLNYRNLEEAINDSNVPMDEIFHTLDYKGQTIIFYGKDDTLGVALIEKGFFGYRWNFGVGSHHLNVEDSMVTKSLSNLYSKNYKSDEDIVTLTYGGINDPSIEQLKIKYKDQDFTEATILETRKGRIWYCFSETPVNYDPEVNIIYKDGTTKSGWY